MTRIIYCQVLKTEAEGLERPPHPGPLGERVYNSVSKEGWKKWLERLAIILNDNRLSTADPASIEIIERHMVGFLFGEGEHGALPPGFRPPAAKK
jgi:Fe-S cluster biosynthesis and repair protein YggX